MKNILDANMVRDLAAALSLADPSFDGPGFIDAGLTGLDDLELTARAWHVAEAMQRFLPQPFERAAEVITASLGPVVPPTGHNGMGPLRYMPHVYFVQKYGLDDFEAAMRLQCELTKRFSSEWSIRAFLVRYPERTYARLMEWTRDKDPHIRRLVSEGSRPRLPWAAHLRAFQKDPRPVFALLERLKDDPEPYVQRSVANSLNDIGKDHPELVVELCRQWARTESPGRKWIVRHALRSLVKKAHEGALETMGVASRPSVSLTGVGLAPASVEIGGQLRFSFSLVSTSDSPQDLLIDYAVYFVKATGASRAKVFKLRRLVLSPSERVDLQGTISFADMTTRRFFPGRHRIEVVINGVALPVASFDVSAAR